MNGQFLAQGHLLGLVLHFWRVVQWSEPVALREHVSLVNLVAIFGAVLAEWTGRHQRVDRTKQTFPFGLQVGLLKVVCCMDITKDRVLDIEQSAFRLIPRGILR